MYKIAYVVTISGTIWAFFIPQLRYLADHGFDVTVICSSDPGLQKALGEKVRFMPVDMPRGISLGGSVKAIRDLTQIFRREKFDLIQYSTPNAALYASIAAKRAGCKTRNYHLMGFRFLGAAGKGRAVLKWIEKTACRNSTHIECVSNSNRELGIREGLFPPDKCVVVWNGSTGGVDLARFDCGKREAWRQEIRRKLGYSADDFVYGFVGRITRDKGIHELLQAYLGLKGDAKLLLVGPTEEMGTLDAALVAKAKEDPGVRFHGPVGDVEKYFAAIDVLVLPSYREGFGNVVIEAAAMGTPAIVTDIPGPTDTVDETTALVVPVKDADALREAMRSIRGRSGEMGENAARFVRDRFDSVRLCEKIAERKRMLLEGRSIRTK